MDTEDTNKQYYNVFEALEDDPEVAENLRIRAQLMTILRKYIKENKITQKEAAEIMNVTQPRISDLIRGKIGLFTVDMLVNMLSHVKIQIDVVVKKAA